MFDRYHVSASIDNKTHIALHLPLCLGQIVTVTAHFMAVNFTLIGY
ncbi:Hypothetical protein ABZS17D1_02527 [Kosakonia cowanii]